jgi:FKBP-type peptidyl-prolyl cis-trans isomerase (trigger factor)
MSLPLRRPCCANPQVEHTGRTPLALAAGSGQEKMVLEFFQKNPGAIENLRSPIFEEKVVDFMLELAKVDEKRVTAEELAAAA